MMANWWTRRRALYIGLVAVGVLLLSYGIWYAIFREVPVTGLNPAP